MNSESEIVQNSSSNQPIPPAPGIAPVGAAKESTLESSIKKQHGGKRPGAGRRPNLAKRLLKGFSREALAEGAADIDVKAIVAGLFKSKNERIRLDTLLFYRDTFMGRPAQNVNLSGTVLHWTPGQFADLTDAEFAELARLNAKRLGLPAPEINQNALPIKPESTPEATPAIEEPAIEVSAKEAHSEATEHA